MNWQAEPHWLTMQRLLTEIRAERAERGVERTSWQVKKLETRVERLQDKVQRRGRVNWRLFQQAKALASRQQVR